MTENSRREKMGKKYLDTKEGSLEQSVLGVWQTAIDEGEARMDGRTKQYKEHRAKLEARRAKSEKLDPVGKEDGDIDNDGDKDSTDKYLAKRRKAISKAIKKDKKEETDLEEGPFSSKSSKAGIGDVAQGVRTIGKKLSPKERDALQKKYGSKAGKKKSSKAYQGKFKEGSKEEYQKFFNAAMKKFGIESPADLKSDEEKKKFFDYVDKNYTGEKNEGAMKRGKDMDTFKPKPKKEKVGLDEKPADFIRLSFNSPADVKKARKWMDQNLPGADQGFTGVDYSGKDIEFEDVDDAEDLMSKLKKAGFKFKVDFREGFQKQHEFKMQSMKNAVRKVWEASDREKIENKREKSVKAKPGKTMTGDDMSVIKINPQIKG